MKLDCNTSFLGCERLKSDRHTLGNVKLGFSFIRYWEYLDALRFVTVGLKPYMELINEIFYSSAILVQPNIGETTATALNSTKIIPRK